MRILVVDAANVVGSVPDGWWNDRAGAARRLVDGIDPDALGFDAALVVLEGRARAGASERGLDNPTPTTTPERIPANPTPTTVPDHPRNPGDPDNPRNPDRTGRIRHGAVAVVHAPGSGDDEIVARCRALASEHEVTLATADRGLIRRVESFGVRIVGPRSVRG